MTICPCHMATGAAPFDALQVADRGDVPINTDHLQKSVAIIEPHDRPIVASGNTALLGANLRYEMLCVLRGVKYR